MDSRSTVGINRPETCPEPHISCDVVPPDITHLLSLLFGPSHVPVRYQLHVGFGASRKVYNKHSC